MRIGSGERNHVIFVERLLTQVCTWRHLQGHQRQERQWNLPSVQQQTADDDNCLRLHVLPGSHHFIPVVFLQARWIASYASAGTAGADIFVYMSVCPSHVRYCIKRNKANTVISSPTESMKTLVFDDIRFIPKGDTPRPKRGRSIGLRLGKHELAIFDL